MTVALCVLAGSYVAEAQVISVGRVTASSPSQLTDFPNMVLLPSMLVIKDPGLRPRLGVAGTFDFAVGGGQVHVGFLGVRVHAGLQFNDRWALYSRLSMGTSIGGLNLQAGALGEYTFRNNWSLGAGLSWQLFGDIIACLSCRSPNANHALGIPIVLSVHSPGRTKYGNRKVFTFGMEFTPALVLGQWGGVALSGGIYIGYDLM